MKQLHEFDEVFDAQKTFRIILEAMANPFRLLSVAKAGEKMFGAYPHMLAVAMTLLDNETTYYVCDEGELSEQIKLLTHARPVEACEADYIFVTKPEQLMQVIEAAKMGTLEDPHKSATLVIENDGDRSKQAEFYGPGIQDMAQVMLTEAMEQAVSLRDAQEYEYPQGIDFIFLSREGTLCCIPRLVLRRK